MLNPIYNKLNKMFAKNKKPASQRQPRLPVVNCIEDTNVSSISNVGKISYAETRVTEPQSSLQSDSFNLGACKIEILKNQLEQYRTLTSKLQQKIKDHQMLEQFYLRQLKNRQEIEGELKWKLDVIGQQIKNNRLSAPLKSRESLVRGMNKQNMRLSENY